jgi:hypothetical protein
LICNPKGRSKRPSYKHLIISKFQIPKAMGATEMPYKFLAAGKPLEPAHLKVRCAGGAGCQPTGVSGALAGHSNVGVQTDAPSYSAGLDGF